MWGFSGGSLATSWAAALQPSYASELSDNLVGALLGGLSSNITRVAFANDGTVRAGLIPSCIIGSGNEYPEFKKKIYEEVHRSRKFALETGEKYCMLKAVATNLWRNFLKGTRPVFPKGPTLLQEEVIAKVIEENSLINFADTLIPEIPILIYHGSLDNIVPIEDPRSLYDSWCQNNIGSLEFAEDMTAGHFVEMFAGIPSAIAWIKARFQGIKPVEGCVHNRRTSNLLYPGSIPAIFQYYKRLLVPAMIRQLELYEKASKDSQISEKTIDVLIGR
ncbi:uncharacterized protein J8A68_002594 [[Candida] subhashii]|uniref:Triacylglycerol lipase n=1 Tax=[Candida] subhashii TaxID=561895 RepID=A0A8J5QG33_9ASCO|nr:uncharacterized protein J8A68_002594 [[Candida] subhashii]KAG7663846.1 hypothetical protein J8A68_002594 [[Candida] subhashii]